MNAELEKKLIDIRAITDKISKLKDYLEKQQKETLEAIIACDAYNKARQNAIDNMGVSNAAVHQEVIFMKDAVSIFGKDVLPEFSKTDKAYAAVVLNEYKYFDYWLANLQLKEVKLSDNTVSTLKNHICALDLPVRVVNVLRASDIDYVFEILQVNPHELKESRNFGANSMKLLNEFLESHGLHFGIFIRYDEQAKEYRTLV